MKDFLATQNMENIIKLYGQEKSEKVCKFYVSAGSRDGLPISTCPRPLSLTSPPLVTTRCASPAPGTTASPRRFFWSLEEGGENASEERR